MTLFRSSPMELKQPDWPASDQMAWELLFTIGDILDGQGPLTHWRQTTRQKCAQSYGYWLAFLAREGRFDDATGPADRVTPEAVKAYVHSTLERCSIETAQMRLNKLGKVVRAMSPTTDWAWLRNAERRLRKQCRHGELKRRASVSASNLYEWGVDRMNSVDANETLPPRERGIQYRQGLIVALLIARPLRLLYRRKVGELQGLLSDDSTRSEAMESIRSLAERIEVSPEGKRGNPSVVLFGALASLLDFACPQKPPPPPGTPMAAVGS